MDQKRTRILLWLMALLTVGLGSLERVPLRAQVVDADCFSGACGGSSGIPECPEDFDEVGFVLYANSKANAGQDCETIVSCTNLGKKTVDLSCRFFHGFFPIRPGGPTEALCSAETPDVAPGDTTECATDATDDPDFQAGGIFLAGDGECPTFEGKGMVCSRGGDVRQVFCEAHLSCGNGAVLESIDVVRRKGTKKAKTKEKKPPKDD